MEDDEEFWLPSDVSIDRWIEIMAGGKEREDLRRFVSKHDYTGDKPRVMLFVYDTIHDLKNGLYYGIKGFEALKRDPKVITELQNPDKLVDYIVATADSLDELVALQENIIKEGRFYSIRYSSIHHEDIKTQKRLAQALLKTAYEIAERQRNFNNDEKSLAAFGGDYKEFYNQFRIRLDAHIAIVLAHYALTGINKDALEAIAAYESIVGAYQSHLFPIDLMEAYFKCIHSADTLSKGEIPEELKAEHDWKGRLMWGVDYDQLFRQEHFGVKEPEWEKRKRQQEEAKRKQEDWIDDLFKIMEDPWAYYKKELGLLGLNKDMEYDEAKRIFRRGIITQRATFIRMDTETPEYKDATKKTQDFLEAWKKVGVLYQNKPDSQSSPST